MIVSVSALKTQQIRHISAVLSHNNWPAMYLSVRTHKNHMKPVERVSPEATVTQSREEPTATHTHTHSRLTVNGGRSASMSNNLKEMETDPLNQQPCPAATRSLAHVLIPRRGHVLYISESYKCTHVTQASHKTAGEAHVELSKSIDFDT